MGGNAVNFFRAVLENNEANTFIGGVSSEIVSAAYLAANSTLLEEEIHSFTIDGDNISYYVNVPYQFTNQIFRNDTNLIYIIDPEGYASLQVWVTYQCPNLKFLYMPNANLSGSRMLRDATGLLKMNAGQNINLGGRWLIENLNAIKKLVLSEFSTYSEDTYTNLYGFASTERIDIRNWSVLSGTIGTWYPYIGSILNNVGEGCKIYHHPALGVQQRKAWNYMNFSGSQIGDTFTIDNRTYTVVAEGTASNDGEFDIGLNNNNTAVNFSEAVNNDTRSGASDFEAYNSGGTWVILRAKSVGTNFEVPTSVGPSNSGATSFRFNDFVGGNDVHPVLYNRVFFNNAVLIECDASIPVNAPSSLNYSNLTSNSVDLNFTEPTANANGNDGYEVWIDDGTVYRKCFEYSEIAGTGATVDLTEIVNDGISIIGMKIKIRTIDGQFNFSPFSNEIITA